METVVIRAQHDFENITKRLQANDRIWFKGNLQTSLTSSQNVQCIPKNDGNVHEKDGTGNLILKQQMIELVAIGCLNCNDKKIKTISIKQYKFDNRLKDLNRGFKYMLNVLFHPLIKFK
jgi:wolfamin